MKISWKSSVLVISSSLVLSSFRLPNLINPPTDPPFLEIPPVQVREKEIQELESIEHRSAYEEYELGLFYILAGKIELGKEHVVKALELKPHFIEAQAQMGFIYLWEDKQHKDEELFNRILEKQKCNKKD